MSTPRTPRRALLAAPALLVLPRMAAAQAAAWPTRPVRLVLPVVAGGALDNVARQLAQQLQQRLGQTFVVENRSGAAGVIGMDAVAKAAPDGYTVTARGRARRAEYRAWDAPAL